MACPLCGEQCRCPFVASRGDVGAELSEHDGRTSVLIDPESYDPTEEQFAASVLDLDEEAPAAPFAAAETGTGESAPPQPDREPRPARETTLTGIERIAHEVYSGTQAATGFADDEGWRDEVHSRLNSYRARRRRVPEGAMPLDFGGDDLAAGPVTRLSAAVQRVATRYANRPPLMSAQELEEPAEAVEVEEEVENNVIEFPKPPEPRSFEFERTAPLPLSDELAEAVQDSPRILEAPTTEELPLVMPPVSAITLDGDDDETASIAVPELELPLRAAPLGQRVFAAMVDTSAVLVASATFALIFVKITGGMPESKLAPVVGALVVGILWAMYQYMFIVYAGTTPGLQVSGLALRDFSGEHLRRLSRRNRAIGMVVAALPLGLGFVWAVLDEDALCWHDRMSHSYVVERGH
jgi:uncharacterized RDD family membrane protein YckC